MNANHVEHYEHLKSLLGKLGKDLPGPMGGFAQLHRQSVTEGALSTKIKELIALGIGIAARCDGCVAFHVHDAVRAGATTEEVLETIGVAVMMGGGPAAMYGCEAYAALQQFQAKDVAQ